MRNGPFGLGQQISKPDGLFYADKETFEAKGAKVYMNSPVESIDYDAKKVTAIVDGKEHVESYDKLILATGSQPICLRLKVLKWILTVGNLSQPWKICSLLNCIKMLQMLLKIARQEQTISNVWQ